LEHIFENVNWHQLIPEYTEPIEQNEFLKVLCQESYAIEIFKELTSLIKFINQRVFVAK